MKMRITMLPVASAFLLSSALVVSACGKTPPQSANGEGAAAETAGHAEDGALKLSADEVRRAGIKLEALVAGTVADSLTVTATIQANQDRIARVAPTQKPRRRQRSRPCSTRPQARSRRPRRNRAAPHRRTACRCWLQSFGLQWFWRGTGLS